MLKRCSSHCLDSEPGITTDLSTNLFDAIVADDMRTASEVVLNETFAVNRTYRYSSLNMLPLGFACLRGCEEIANFMCDHGADVNCAASDGRTPLHYSCDENTDTERHLHILQRLLQRGAEVDRQDNIGRTALYLACESNAPRKVEKLIEAGCEVNIKTYSGYSPLQVACKDAEFWFYSHNRDTQEEHIATQDGFNFPSDKIVKLLLMLVKMLLKAKADPREATLLPTLVQFGNVTMLEEFLALGMDVNMVDDNNRTPLGRACSSNHVTVDVVRLLLEYGADVNAGGGLKKLKPIILACANNSFQKMKVLLSYGAEVSSEEMSELVSLTLRKTVLENPDVIRPSSRELYPWRLLLSSGFQPVIQGPLATKVNHLTMCSSYPKIEKWIKPLLSPLRSLVELCRIAVRNSISPVKDEKILLLPLPVKLKAYLTFDEFR